MLLQACAHIRSIAHGYALALMAPLFADRTRLSQQPCSPPKVNLSMFLRHLGLSSAFEHPHRATPGRNRRSTLASPRRPGHKRRVSIASFVRSRQGDCFGAKAVRGSRLHETREHREAPRRLGSANSMTRCPTSYLSTSTLRLRAALRPRTPKTGILSPYDYPTHVEPDSNKAHITAVIAA